MITTALMTLALNVWTVMLGLLPSGSLPSGVTDAITFFGESMYTFNWLLPIDSMMDVVIAFLVFEGGMMLFNFAVWFYNRVPFKAT